MNRLPGKNLICELRVLGINRPTEIAIVIGVNLALYESD